MKKLAMAVADITAHVPFRMRQEIDDDSPRREADNGRDCTVSNRVRHCGLSNRARSRSSGVLRGRS
jgi:hypothetical protein